MDMSNNILCIHHADSDGRLAGAIVKQQYPEARMVEVGYNNFGKELAFIFMTKMKPEYDKVFIVDFSLPKDHMLTLINNYDVVWCDHHKSAMEKLPELWKSEEVAGIRSLDGCGAVLTNLYFKNTTFKELELVDDYDRWIHKMGPETNYFAEINKDWTVDEWGTILNLAQDNNSVLDQAIEQGKVLFELKEKRVKDHIKTGRAVEFRDEKAYFVNNTNFFDGALLGNEICKRGYAIAIKFSFNKDKVIVGLNSIGDLDVSLIAKDFGGGGHKNAAGFNMDYEEFHNFMTQELGL